MPPTDKEISTAWAHVDSLRALARQSYRSAVTKRSLADVISGKRSRSAMKAAATRLENKGGSFDSAADRLEAGLKAKGYARP